MIILRAAAYVLLSTPLILISAIIGLPLRLIIWLIGRVVLVLLHVEITLRNILSAAHRLLKKPIAFIESIWHT